MYLQDISHTTTHDNFTKTWGHDPRFEALERKDRESLLNERCADLFGSIVFGVTL